MPDNLKPESAEVGAMSAAAKRWVAGKSLLGDPAAEDFANLVFFPVVTPQGALSSRALQSVRAGRGAQADIPEGARNSAQAMALNLLESEFDMESDNAAQNVRGGLRGAFEQIAIALGFKDAITDNNAEVVMSEQIARILEDGRHGFTEDELKAMPESALDKLAANLEEVVEEETPEVTESEAQEAPVLPPEFAGLLQLVEAVGPEKLAALLTNAEKQEQEQREKLVADIVANTDLQAAELEGWTMKQLETLNASIAKVSKPRNYAGPGVGPQANAAGKKQRVVMTF
jgi:hypothetical protein